jgi:FAD-linked oxidoreductase
MTNISRRTALKGAALGLAPVAALAANPAKTPATAASAASAAPPAVVPDSPAYRPMVAWSNWSGSSTAKARQMAVPADVGALQQLLRNSTDTIRCVGAGHSFTPLVPTEGVILSLDRISGVPALDKSAQIATVLGGTRLGVLSRALEQGGMALRNMPDIDAQSYAGAISTATHGTGAQLPALHADVVGMQMVLADGSLMDCNARQNPQVLAAARVGLGALGVITQVQVQVVPAFNLRRRVWLLPVNELLDQAYDLAKKSRHFEFYYLPFTGYAAAITHEETEATHVHREPSADEEMLHDLRSLRDWLGRFPDLRRWVAQKLIDPNMVETAQDRSWRLLSTQRPTKFNESECHVPRDLGVACVREVIQVLEKRNEVFFPMEFRFIKGDDAWLSPFHLRDSCSIAVHAAAGEPFDYLVKEVGPVFRKYEGRPHWGKHHGHTAADFAQLYPRWKDFLAVRAQLDPRGRFLNPHLRSVFGLTA